MSDRYSFQLHYIDCSTTSLPEIKHKFRNTKRNKPLLQLLLQLSDIATGQPHVLSGSVAEVVTRLELLPARQMTV